jgi:O-antigen/teichoic acid export membrane protein
MQDGPGIDAGRRTVTVAALLGSGLVLNVGVAVVLGRMLGVGGYGAYAAGVGLATVLSAPAALGARPLLIRGTAAYSAAGEWGLLRGMIGRTLAIGTLTSCLVGAAACTVVVAVGDASEVRSAMLASALLLPLMTVTLMTQGLLQGMRRLAAAFAPTTMLRPLALLAILGVLAVAGTEPSPGAAVLLQAAATALALVVSFGLVRQLLPRAVRDVAPSYATGEWVRRAVPMGLASGLNIVSGGIGIVLVGAISSAHEAGLLGAAVRVSSGAVLVSWAANEAFQPEVATAFASGKPGELQRTVTALTRAVAATTVVAALAVALLAGPLLSVFGSGFDDGVTALRVLCLAAVVNAAASVNVTLLVMTEHQRSAAFAAAAGLAVTVVLSALMIPPLGAAGGAWAFLGGVVARNVIASCLTLAKLGVDSTVLGRRARPRPAQP